MAWPTSLAMPRGFPEGGDEPPRRAKHRQKAAFTLLPSDAQPKWLCGFTDAVNLFPEKQ
jgi:hypothetical protein